MPGQVHLVTQDTHDEDVIGLDQIDDVVLGVVMDAHRRIVFWPLSGDAGVVGDDGDGGQNTFTFQSDAFGTFTICVGRAGADGGTLAGGGSVTFNWS